MPGGAFWFTRIVTGTSFVSSEVSSIRPRVISIQLVTDVVRSLIEAGTKLFISLSSPTVISFTEAYNRAGRLSKLVMVRVLVKVSCGSASMSIIIGETEYSACTKESGSARRMKKATKKFFEFISNQYDGTAK